MIDGTIIIGRAFVAGCSVALDVSMYDYQTDCYTDIGCFNMARERCNILRGKNKIKVDYLHDDSRIYIDLDELRIYRAWNYSEGSLAETIVPDREQVNGDYTAIDLDAVLKERR